MKLKVRYARVVIMEAIVEHHDEFDVAGIDAKLPSVYPSSCPPDHVLEVVDYEVIWKVQKAEEVGPGECQ